jgi:hypothetical protein
VPEVVPLDIDKPHDAALGIPQHAFAELALGVEQCANLGLYLHPASTQ